MSENQGKNIVDDHFLHSLQVINPPPMHQQYRKTSTRVQAKINGEFFSCEHYQLKTAVTILSWFLRQEKLINIFLILVMQILPFKTKHAF